MDTLLLQLLNGLVSGMLLFIMAAGLSLIFGQMNVINLSHGAIYLLGSYLGYTVATHLDNFWLALLIVPPLVGVVGFLIERVLLRRFYGSDNHLRQVLLTFGLALVVVDLIEWGWGATPLTVSAPALLSGTVAVAGLQFPVYRLSIILFGAALALVLWLLLERTRIGAIVRAGVTDATLVSGLGINIERVFAGVFIVGTMLAALAGVLGAPIFSLYLGLDFELLILAIVVVVIGGLGSLRGAFWGALLIGIADTFGKAYLPEFALFIIFALMAAVLLWRPSGLFGLAGLE